VAGGLVAVGVLLWVEVTVAGNGVKLDERDPATIDAHIDGATTEPRSPADASAPGGAGALRIVWFGDSLAAGVGTSSPDGAVARQVARRLGRPVDVEVLAVSGARIADVVDQQLPRLSGVPDMAIISVGANDVTHLTSLDQFRERYEQFFARLSPTTIVVVLGVPDMGSATRLAQPLRALAGVRGNQLDVVAHDLAREHSAAYVNIAAQTGPSFRADPDRFFAADHYHPSDAGYGVWADAIVPVLQWKLAAHDHPDQPVPAAPKEST
jgi:lysophospholipase L1-like esterase